MHELSRAQFILSEVKKHHPDARSVLLGHAPYTSIDTRELIECLEMIQRDTVKKISFQTIIIESAILCKGCGKHFEQEKIQLQCRNCGSKQLDMYPIDKIEIMKVET